MSSYYRKVIWHEGMFLRPQHFQQHDRYLEHFLEMRCKDIRPYSWGVLKLEVDHSSLNEGKFALAECSAIMLDGTVIEFSKNNLNPLPELEIPQNIREEIVYLAIPSKRNDSTEAFVVQPNTNSNEIIRYKRETQSVQDTNARGMKDPVPLEIGTLNIRFLLKRDARDQYTCLGVARIQKLEGKQVQLDSQFIPPTLDCHATAILSNDLKDLLSKLREKGDGLAQLASNTGSTLPAVIDFLLLQLINRYEPLLLHFQQIKPLHPELLYRELVSLAGELATFFHEDTNNRPQFVNRSIYVHQYEHDNLSATFEPVVKDILESLNKIVTHRYALQIPLTPFNYGIQRALRGDDKMPADIKDHWSELFQECRLVLGVRAKVEAEVVEKEFPHQAKIGVADKNASSYIVTLVNKALPGIKMRLTDAPNEIRRHLDFIYFELDRSNEFWRELSEYESVAVYVPEAFKEVKLELWAIKGGKRF